MAKRVTTEERARIVEAFATGKSCGQIAKDFGRSPDTISRIARQEGHEFGHTNLANAHRINRRYGAEWRAETRQRLSDQIHRELSKFSQPQHVYNFGGKDNNYNEAEIPEPDARMRRDMSATITSLWRVVKEIDEYENASVNRGQLDAIYQYIAGQADEYASHSIPEAGVVDSAGDSAD